jgi:hypothetical protein
MNPIYDETRRLSNRRVPQKPGRGSPTVPNRDHRHDEDRPRVIGCISGLPDYLSRTLKSWAGNTRVNAMAQTRIQSETRAPSTTKTGSEKRTYFKQADFPQTTLQQAQKIASALIDNFAGRDGSPPDIALAIGVSPTSSAWPALAGASIAYGLTEGGVNANAIKLTPLGRKLVAPEEEGDDLTARREAILKPRISKEFFERYRRAKFPNDTIASNVLRTFGLPPDRLQSALEIVKENGRYAGIIRQTPTGPFVNLDSPGVPAPTATPALPDHDVDEEAATGEKVAASIQTAAENGSTSASQTSLPLCLRSIPRAIGCSYPMANS